MPEPSLEDDIVARQIVDAAFTVHRTLGPGLLESVYEQCLVCELISRNLDARSQVALPVVYRDIRVDAGFRMDIFVNGSIIIEVKAVEKALPIHEAQLLTYLKLSGRRIGFLINFNLTLIKYGIKRMIRPY